MERQRDLQSFGEKDSGSPIVTSDFILVYEIIELSMRCIIFWSHGNLNYYNSYTNKFASKLLVARGRPRRLSSIDELFLTLVRLRLNLFQKDLAGRFNISKCRVFEIFSTWIDCMHDCFRLPKLNFTAQPNVMKQHLPAGFKSTHGDVSRIIEGTEIFLAFSGYSVISHLVRI